MALKYFDVQKSSVKVAFTVFIIIYGFWMYQHHQGSEPQYSFSLEQQYAWFQQQRDTAPAVQYLEEAVGVNFSLPHAPKAGKTELETGGWILKPEKLRGAHRLDPYLCKALEETLFRGKSVLDLGCGIGLYGICFLRLKNHPFSDPGTDIFTSTLKGLREWWTSTKPMIGSWTGYDGNPHVEDLTFGLVRRFDLSKPGSIGKTFDWVMSLEVGEHIPREYQDIYIDNLIRHAKEGIVLSWAVEGQGGRSHVNERNNDVIIEILQGRGFFPQPEIWKALRASSSFHWLKNTIMVFTRGEHFQVQ